MAKNTGLGKGINALFTERYNETENDSIEEIVSKSEKVTLKQDNIEYNVDGKMVVDLKITEVEPNITQARKFFDEVKLQELAESIKNFGIIQPIIVSKKSGYYEIIAGERRWRAAKLVGLKTIPSIIIEEDESKNPKLSIIENIQRENLNPIEKAKGYRSIMDEYDYSIIEFAKLIGKKPNHVGEIISLLELDSEVIKYLEKTNISEGACKALLLIDNPEIQKEMAYYIVEDGLTVDEARRRLRLKEAKKNPSVIVDPIYREIEERFTNFFGSKTKLKVSPRGNKNGQIVIKYSSTDDLERILGLLHD